MVFRLTPDAIEDINAIWSFIFSDSPDAADQVEAEIHSACMMLSNQPFAGRVREDLTSLPVRFWTVPKYPNFIIVYRPERSLK